MLDALAEKYHWVTKRQAYLKKEELESLALPIYIVKFEGKITIFNLTVHRSA